MAIDDTSKTDSLRAALLERETARYLQYRGTADQLIEAGLVERHELPGMPGRRKTRELYDLPDGSSISIHPAGKTKFSVHHFRPEDEARRLMCEERAAEKIAKLPATREKYREGVLASTRFCLPQFLDWLTLPAGGFRYSESARATLREVAREIEHLLTAEQIVFDRDALDRQIVSIREEAGCDPAEVVDPFAPLHLAANNEGPQRRGNGNTTTPRLRLVSNAPQEVQHG